MRRTPSRPPHGGHRDEIFLRKSAHPGLCDAKSGTLPGIFFSRRSSREDRAGSACAAVPMPASRTEHGMPSKKNRFFSAVFFMRAGTRGVQRPPAPHAPPPLRAAMGAGEATAGAKKNARGC